MQHFVHLVLSLQVLTLPVLSVWLLTTGVIIDGGSRLRANNACSHRYFLSLHFLFMACRLETQDRLIFNFVNFGFLFAFLFNLGTHLPDGLIDTGKFKLLVSFKILDSPLLAFDNLDHLRNIDFFVKVDVLHPRLQMLEFLFIIDVRIFQLFI